MTGGRPSEGSRRSGPAGPWRWIRVGPGLLLAIVAGYLVWRHDPFRSRRPPAAPAAGHGPVGAPLLPPPAAPDLGFVLARRGELGLSAPQLRSLSAIHQRWERETAGIRAALDRSAAEFGAAMPAGRPQGATLEDLQARTAAVSSYSRQLFAARRRAWAEAAEKLTPSQRSAAEDLWRDSLRGRGPRTGSNPGPSRRR